jgi:hypothetical protein
MSVLFLASLSLPYFVLVNFQGSNSVSLEDRLQGPTSAPKPSGHRVPHMKSRSISVQPTCSFLYI